MNNEESYIFWVGQIRYSGKIVSEDEKFYTIFDDKLDREVKIPKNLAVVINPKPKKTEEEDL